MRRHARSPHQNAKNLDGRCGRKYFDRVIFLRALGMKFVIFLKLRFEFIDIMKRILLAFLSSTLISIAISASFSISASAQQITGTNLMATGKTHVISDASSGGGGEDRRREELSLKVVDGTGQATSAKCDLTNDKGNWSTTAPGTVTVLRSAADLTVVCAKDGIAPHTLVVSAGTTQIQPKHFRFQADSDDSDDAITVPYYTATLTLTLTAASTPPPTN
jgi:hypothetical protein